MKIELNDKIIDVIILKKNIKNIYFRFDDKLNLVISTPKRTSLKEINNLIQKNQESLIKMYDRLLNRIEDINEFKYLGNTYEIKYADVNNVVLSDGYVYTKDKAMLDKFINEKRIEIYKEEVNKLKEIIKTPNFSLKIRKMKTRWGVCNYKNMTITLNSELIKYDLELLRYVIVHEMCHFTHHDHSANFWKMVSIYYPNYKKARKELRG